MSLIKLISIYDVNTALTLIVNAVNVNAVNAYGNVEKQVKMESI